MLNSEEVEARIAACLERPSNLKAQAQAPWLCQQHLRQGLNEAKDRRDVKAITAINGILRKESDRRRWKNVNWGSKPDSGGAVTRLKVPDDAGDVLYARYQGWT